MLRHSNGEAVHFGGDAVALEKDEVFKRACVHGEYSRYFFPPPGFCRRMLLRDARWLSREGRNNQRIAASMTMCIYMYIWMSVTRLRQPTKCIGKCVFASVSGHLFFLNNLFPEQTNCSLLYVIYWGPEVLVPLDHDWRRLQISVLYTMAEYTCVRACARARFRSMSTRRPASQQLS